MSNNSGQRNRCRCGCGASWPSDERCADAARLSPLAARAAFGLVTIAFAQCVVDRPPLPRGGLPPGATRWKGDQRYVMDHGRVGTTCDRRAIDLYVGPRGPREARR